MQVKELREQLLEFQSKVNLESYINYFFETTGSFVDLFDAEKTCIFLDEIERPNILSFTCMTAMNNLFTKRSHKNKKNIS